MYNEDLKLKFINDITNVEKTAYTYKAYFNALEPFENKWGSDICTRSKEEVTEALESITGIKNTTNISTTLFLKRYVKWCIKNNVEGASDELLDIRLSGNSKMTTQMVSSPLQMHKYLCDVFSDDPNPTIDDVYKGFFWLAFFGLRLEEALLVKTSDVDIDKRIIVYRDGEKTVDIYPKAVHTFENLLSSHMIYRKEDYKESVRIRERASGDLLLRGIKKSSWEPRQIQNVTSDKVRVAYASGKTNKKLSYERAYLSGIFCRAYEIEEAYGVVDFTDIAVDEFTSVEYNGVAPLKKRISKQAKDYMIDYNKWKAAFNKQL